MTNKEQLLCEFKKIIKIIHKADTIVLYGNTIISPIVKTALEDFNIKNKTFCFDNGKFIDRDDESGIGKAVVILSAARKTTRNSMRKDARIYFSEATVIDFFEIYYAWLVLIVKRPCNHDILADTIIRCKNEEDVLINIDSINTLYCNLNCKECSNGIQHRIEKRHIKVENQIKYLNKLTKYVPIYECNFQGGEVFADPNFKEFVLNHAQNPRIAIFSVATNGTILPNDDFFIAMRKIGAMFRISNYGAVSKSMDAIIDKSKKYHIPCIGYPRAEQWRRFGEFVSRNRAEEELKKVCESCFFGTRDMMFVEDKLFCCLRTLYADAIGHESEAVKQNTLNLDKDFSKEELMNIIKGKNLWKMCDYCDYPMEIIAPAEQVAKKGGYNRG